MFCFLEGVYAWYLMTSWNIMYDRSYYDFCMLAVILSFGILPMVSQMSLYRQVLQCLWSFLSRFVMSPKHPLVRSHFVPPHVCFLLLFKSQLKLKSLEAKNFDHSVQCVHCCPQWSPLQGQFFRHSLRKQVCWSVFGAWKRKRHICTKRKNNLTPKCAFPAHHLPHSSL